MGACARIMPQAAVTARMGGIKMGRPWLAGGPIGGRESGRRGKGGFRPPSFDFT